MYYSTLNYIYLIFCFSFFRSFQFVGSSESSGLPDIGIFITVKKPQGGQAFMTKYANGISVGKGSRESFDGTDAQISISLGKTGIDIVPGELEGEDMAVGVTLGPQLGYQVSTTQTVSLTIGDIARMIAELMYEPPCP
jgi:hypothetical protein